MKSNSVFILCVLVVSCFLLTNVDGRKSRGGSRGSGKSSRGSGGRRAPQPSAGPDFSVQAPKKPSAPDGWSIKKDNTIKKDVSTNVKSNPVNSASNPSYPASSGLSGTGAAGAAGATGGAAGAASHSYPASNGLSGAAAQPSYPAGSGLSGSSPVKAAPPAYSQNAPPAYNAPPPYSANAPVHGYNQPMGGYNGPPPAYGGGQGYAVPGYVNNPMGGPPMSYGNTFPSRGMAGGMGGYGGMGGMGGGFLGNSYGKSSSFLGNNKLGLILTGLTVWNLMRSGRSHNTYNYYNHGPDGPERERDPEMEAVLRELSNCTLTVTSTNDTDVLLIPCEIATSFAPNAKLDGKSNIPAFTPEADSPLNCTITVYTNNGLEIKTNIPCDQLSSMAPKESVPPPDSNPVPANDAVNINPNCNGGVDSLTGAACVNEAQQIPQVPPIPPVLLPVDQPILLDPIVSTSTLNPPSSSSTPAIESTSQTTSSSTIDLMAE